MPADPELYRAVIGQFPTGVSVVTAVGPEGPVGMTANAVCSLSLEPVLLIVCFDNSSRTLPLIRQATRFGINVLAADQEEISARFASKLPEREKFEPVPHAVRDGVPVIDGVVAWLACDLEAMHPGGDHTIGVGQVTHMEHGSARDPLVWFRGGYARVHAHSGAAGAGGPDESAAPG